MSRLASLGRRITRRAGFEVVRSYPGATPRHSQRAPGSGEPSTVQADGRLWVSFSLFGTESVYVEGIAEALSSYERHFPGWTPVVFAGDSVPRRSLTQLARGWNATIVEMPGAAEDWSALLWRYLALDLLTEGVVLFRDADSRACPRERAAVDEWLASGLDFHIMRDHPHHFHAIMGGMWGARIGALGSVTDLMTQYGPDAEFGTDQRFLRSVVYPAARSSCLAHEDQEFFKDDPGVIVREFPLAGDPSMFVGQGFEVSGRPRDGHETPPHTSRENVGR